MLLGNQNVLYFNDDQEVQEPIMLFYAVCGVVKPPKAKLRDASR